MLGITTRIEVIWVVEWQINIVNVDEHSCEQPRNELAKEIWDISSRSTNVRRIHEQQVSRGPFAFGQA